ncbi:MAG TPA: alpha/beta fold hydrolase [Euzebyales bacterium]|nr:alpha/beta fold hydrolase [Euzebyales bacterium]
MIATTGSDDAARTTTRDRVLADTPVRDRRMNLSGIPTAVLEGGDGAPMVLLHSSGEFAALWRRVLPELVRTHRVIAPDLPGHGASGVPAGPLDVDRTAAWLGALIERTCPSPPILVGRGLGGAIAARYAVDHSDRLERLVLVGAFGLAPFEPVPGFAVALNEFMAQPTAQTRCSSTASSTSTACGRRWVSGGNRSPATPSNVPARRPCRRRPRISCGTSACRPSRKRISTGSPCRRR